MTRSTPPASLTSSSKTLLSTVSPTQGRPIGQYPRTSVFARWGERAVPRIVDTNRIFQVSGLHPQSQLAGAQSHSGTHTIGSRNLASRNIDMRQASLVWRLGLRAAIRLLNKPAPQKPIGSLISSAPGIGLPPLASRR